MFLAQSLLVFNGIFAVAFAQGSKTIIEKVELTNVTKKTLANCDSRRLFYQELQCTPQTFNWIGCATSYTCPTYTTGSNYCRYRGSSYNFDEQVPNSLTPSCRFGCGCVQSYLNPGETELSCAQPKCFGGSDTANCYMGYTTENLCCPYQEFCAPFEVGTCTLGNNVYRLNQRYEPDNTCSICICKKNQQGVAVSQCQKKVCGMEIKNSYKIKNNCAPLYSGDNCCPSEMVCSEDLQNINFSNFPTHTTGTCKFNAFNLPRGTTFTADKSGLQITCSCTIPPFLTCTS